MQNVQQLACMQNVQQLACVHTCRMFNDWHVCNMLIVACGISIFEPGDYENVDCHMWVSTRRDSRTPEFRDLKAFRTVVSLFVDLVKFSVFPVNFEEGPFGRGLGTSQSGDSRSPEFRSLKTSRVVVSLFIVFVKICMISVNFEEGPWEPVEFRIPRVGMRNVHTLGCLPACRVFNSWHVSGCKV